MFVRLGFALVMLGCNLTPSAATAESARQPGRDSTIRMSLRNNYQVIIPVSVGGLEPLNFILDTGTKTTLVDERVGRRLAFPVVAHLQLTTFTGATIAVVRRLESISVGPAVVRGLDVGCLDLRATYALDPDVQGVLGQDFLGRFNYVIDYRGRRVVFDDGTLDGSLAGERLPIERRDFRDHVVDVRRPDAPGRLHLMLDSGAPFAILFRVPAPGSDIRVELDHRSASFVNGLGRRSTEVARISALRLGGTTLRNLAAHLARPRADERRWEDGLLPTSLFSSIYFNHSLNYVLLNCRLSGR